MAKQVAQSASAKVLGGAKKTDVLIEVAKEVETLSQKKAFELVDELINEGGVSDFRLGGALAVISDKAKAEGGQEWLEGHATFKELCDARFGIHYRKAMYLIDIYKHLVEQQISWNEVKSLGWTKIATLCEFKVLTSKTVEKWVQKAEKMTVMQLRDSLKTGESSSKKSTKTFPVFEDQKEAIDLAIEKAKKETKTDHDGVALHNMAQAYLGNAVTMQVENALEEKPKQKGKLKEYWAERLKVAFKEITEDLGDGKDGGPGLIMTVFDEEFPKIKVEVEFPA